jgi:ferredoxin-thioredoxin reductase catalytic subunit
MLNKEKFSEVVEKLIKGEEYEKFKSFTCDGYRLNRKENHVKIIVEGLKNKEQFCPCKLQKTDENLCPCDEFIKTGVCHCGLWVKEE